MATLTVDFFTSLDGNGSAHGWTDTQQLRLAQHRPRSPVLSARTYTIGDIGEWRLKALSCAD